MKLTFPRFRAHSTVTADWARHPTVSLVGCVFLGILLATPIPLAAQSPSVRLDRDGVLAPNEVPDPRLDYSKDRLMPAAGTRAASSHDGCGTRRGDNPRSPTVEITQEKHGNGTVQRGVLEGECLKSAAIYEGGKRIQTIALFTSSERTRFPFEIKAESLAGLEVRVYSSDGRRAIMPLVPR